MTLSKKNENSKKETLKSYNNFLLDIEKYYSKSIKDFDNRNKLKLESIEDKLYFITLKKDIKIENILKKKIEDEEDYEKKLESIKIQHEDLRIDESKYNLLIKNTKEKYKNGNLFEQKSQENIKKIRLAHEKKEKKLRSLHKKKKQLYEEYRKKYVKKELKIKEKSIKNLQNKKNLVFESNKNFHKKIDNKINLFIEKQNTKKVHLKKSFDEKQIGVHTYNEKIKTIDKKIKEIKNTASFKKINYKPLVLNKEILMTKSKRVFNENNDRFFLPGLLNEIKKIISKNKIIFIILLLLFYTALNNSAFWKFETFSNIMKNNSEIMILALSMTMVILTGGIDLSVGSLMAFSAIIMANMADKGSNIYASIFVGILVSTLLGFAQGVLIGYARMVPFVVTLGGLLAYRGASVLVANARPIQPAGKAHDVLEKISNSEFLGLNIQIWIVLICFVIFLFVLKFTVFGRQIYGIGSNRRAAFLSGVKDKRVETAVYTLSGFMSGVAGLLITARTQSISPGTGNAWELQAIACVVIGGTALTGGKGGVVGTIIGWLILSALPTTFQTLGINPNMQKVSTGIIIIVAVLLNNNLDFKGGLIGIKKRISTLFNQYFKRRKI